MNREIVNKLSMAEHQGLVIEQYAASEPSKDEAGDVCVVVRGLILKPMQSMAGSQVIDNIYCDHATITFKKDDAI